MIRLVEPSDESWVDTAQRRVRIQVVLLKLLLEVVLDEHGKAMLQEGAHITTIRAMTVANGEKVAVLQAHNVWVCDVGILIHLVGVVC